jgi:hypothetical protein
VEQVSEKKVILGSSTVGRTDWRPQEVSRYCPFARRGSADGRAKRIASSPLENEMAQKLRAALNYFRDRARLHAERSEYASSARILANA